MLYMEMQYLFKKSPSARSVFDVRGWNGSKSFMLLQIKKFSYRSDFS